MRHSDSPQTRGLPSIPGSRCPASPGQAPGPHRAEGRRAWERCSPPGTHARPSPAPKNLQNTFFFRNYHPLLRATGCVYGLAAACFPHRRQLVLHSQNTHSEAFPSLSRFGIIIFFYYYYYYYYFLELCTAAKSNFLPPQPSPRRGSDHTNQVSSATLGTPAVGAGEQLDSSVSSRPHYKLVCKDRRHPRLLRGFLGARLTREVFGPVFVHVLGQIAPSGDESPVEGGGWVLINTSADGACSCLRRENPPSLVPALLKSSPFQASRSCGSPRGVS